MVQKVLPQSGLAVANLSRGRVDDSSDTHSRLEQSRPDVENSAFGDQSRNIHGTVP